MRPIRITLAIIFLAASLAYLLLGVHVIPVSAFAYKSQIIPSAIASTIGATAFWLIVSFLFGRIYCATVCPVGTLQDLAIWLRRAFCRTRRPFRFEAPYRARYDILIVYLICLLLGIMGVCFVIEPWNIMRNITSLIRPANLADTWATLSFGASVGMVAGAVSLIALLVWAWAEGRAFCTKVCPIGTALGCMQHQNMMHIEIDPDKCISCMKCEDLCPSKCIKIVSRYVDNSRCVRCFDCTHVCPTDAIRYQKNRNRRFSTPLLRRHIKA